MLVNWKAVALNPKTVINMSGYIQQQQEVHGRSETKKSSPQKTSSFKQKSRVPQSNRKKQLCPQGTGCEQLAGFKKGRNITRAWLANTEKRGQQQSALTCKYTIILEKSSSRQPDVQGLSVCPEAEVEHEVQKHTEMVCKHPKDKVPQNANEQSTAYLTMLAGSRLQPSSKRDDHKVASGTV